MTIAFHALEPGFVAAIRAGGPDAYGAPAERTVSDGGGNPCRACLDDVPKGAEMLILAHRPFPEAQPYAETGPIFLCGQCKPRPASATPPPAIQARPDFLVKGYGENDRIVYGTGRITPSAAVAGYCEELLSQPRIAYVDIRSARNNCFICRVKRA